MRLINKLQLKGVRIKKIFIILIIDLNTVFDEILIKFIDNLIVNIFLKFWKKYHQGELVKEHETVKL